MVQPGKYEASPADWGSAETKSGKPYVYAYFNVDGGSVKWTGYLTPAAIEKTMEQLTFMGCRDFVAIADGVMGGALDPNKKVKITVDHEVDDKDASKKYAKVKWVNPLGTTKDAASIAQAKDTLAKYAGQFLAAQQKAGATNTKKVSVGF